MRPICLRLIGSILITLLSVACSDKNNPTKSAQTPTYPNQLGVNRISWSSASEPAQLPPGGVAGKVMWHTPMSLPRVDDVFPAAYFPEWANSGSGSIQTLKIVFRPVDASRPLDQWLTSHGVSLPAHPAAHAPSWAGIMREIPNLEITSDTKYFMLRLRATSAIIHFDFGSFREDRDGDGYLFTEDVYENGITDIEEDIGLDGLADQNEPGYDPSARVDPYDDNWFFWGEGKSPVPAGLGAVLAQELATQEDAHPLFFEWINGTEGNRYDIASAALPDDEQIGAAPVLSEDYFSYVITPGAALDPYHIAGLDNEGWRTYQIPLRDLNAIDTIVGSPSWSAVRYVRVWLEAAADDNVTDTVEIADWHLGK